MLKYEFCLINVMPKFNEKMSYGELSESSRKKLAQATLKAVKSGFTINELLDMNETEFKEAYNYKGKNFKAEQRVLKQAKGTSERKQENKTFVVKKLKKEGWTGKKLVQLTKDTNKTLGNTFADVFERVKNSNPDISDDDAKEYTRQLLKIPIQEINNLNNVDKEIIEGYETTP